MRSFRLMRIRWILLKKNLRETKNRAYRECPEFKPVDLVRNKKGIGRCNPALPKLRSAQSLACLQYKHPGPYVLCHGSAVTKNRTRYIAFRPVDLSRISLAHELAK